MIQRLEVEADEMAGFVRKKANKQWIWIAMDAHTRQELGRSYRRAAGAAQSRRINDEAPAGSSSVRGLRVVFPGLRFRSESPAPQPLAQPP